MTFPGVPSALRAFRLQHLYTLDRLFHDPAVANGTIQLDGAEELEILDARGRRVEMIQVKAHAGTPLLPTDLGTTTGEPYFRRAFERFRSDPTAIQRVVTFGPIDLTLRVLSGASGHPTGESRIFIERFGFSWNQTNEWRPLFHIDILDEAGLEARVLCTVGQSVPMPEAEEAFLYLSAWLARTMEKRRRVTAVEARERLRAIARYEADTRSHGAEWFATLRRFEDAEGAESRADAFGSSKVLVIHGGAPLAREAAGREQLLTGTPSAWRFLVHPQEGGGTAALVQKVLLHARAVGVPLLLWWNVTPRDTSWVALVEELRQLADVQLVVTITEREWLRARNAGGTVMFADIALGDEATEGDDVLTRLLRGEDVEPSWSAAAIALLPELDDRDLAPLLMFAITDRPAEDTAAILEAISTYTPRTWTAAAAVLRALMVHAGYRYARDHQELIAEAQGQIAVWEAAWGVLDPVDITRVVPSLANGLQTIFDATDEMHEWHEGFATRKPSTEEVFREAFAWLRTVTLPPPPTTASEWSDAAEVAFWAGFWDVADPKAFAPLEEQLRDGGGDLPLATLADVLFAFWCIKDLDIEAAQLKALARFREETRSVAIQSDGTTATVHYLPPQGDDGTLDLDREATSRMDLLRRLLPDQEFYAAQGYGNIYASAPHIFADDPSKRDATPVDKFPVPWVLRMQLFFMRTGRYQQRRNPWEQYAEDMVALRRRVANIANRITAGLQTYFRGEKPKSIFELGIEQEEWRSLIEDLGTLPKLPNSQIDEWGFELTHQGETRTCGSRNEHGPLLSAVHAYMSAVQKFIRDSWPFFLTHPWIGRGPKEAVAKAEEFLRENTKLHSGLAVQHLAAAVNALADLQREFRLRFERLVDAQELEELENDERQRFWAMWTLWHPFATRPRQKFGDARKEAPAAVEERIASRRRSLRKRMRELETSKVEIYAERPRWSEGAGLWLTFDVEKPEDVVPGFAYALSHTVDVLRPPADLHAFDRHVLDLVWGYVHLVPLVRGQSLTRAKWTFSIEDLPVSGGTLQGAWNLLPVKMHDELWETLEVPEWPSTVAADAKKLEDETRAAKITLDLLLHMPTAPISDERGRAILAGYATEMVAKSGRHLHAAAMAAERAKLALLPEDLIDATLALRTALAALYDALSDLAPTAWEPIAALRDAMMVKAVTPAETISEAWTAAELAAVD
ncbi:MAG: hypothetical protein QOH21_1389 [Acidobacteriota bacterium]|jgi:hypothetical protein|nr:hypothetical protein [Acidobacteriota bacterium]